MWTRRYATNEPTVNEAIDPYRATHAKRELCVYLIQGIENTQRETAHAERKTARGSTNESSFALAERAAWTAPKERARPTNSATTRSADTSSPVDIDSEHVGRCGMASLDLGPLPSSAPLGFDLGTHEMRW
jgi:hypothetical protein